MKEEIEFEFQFRTVFFNKVNSCSFFGENIIRIPNFLSTFRQILRHGNSNLALVINHHHIISVLRPFASSQAGSRYYFSLSKPEIFPCFTALVRRKIDAEMTLT